MGIGGAEHDSPPVGHVVVADLDVGGPSFELSESWHLTSVDLGGIAEVAGGKPVGLGEMSADQLGLDSAYYLEVCFKDLQVELTGGVIPHRFCAPCPTFARDARASDTFQLSEARNAIDETRGGLMSETTGSGQVSAGEQLKHLVKNRMNQGVGVAAKAAGQQAGTFAQAVRQAGEEMRQRGQENQGTAADRVAAPVQRLSGTLGEADPEQLTSSVKQVKPNLTQKAQQLKTQAGDQLKKQMGTRAAQAGQSVTAVSLGVRQTGEQLRAQGQEEPALLLDVLAEKVEPFGRYLVTADPNQLVSDMTAYGRRLKSGLSSAGNAVTVKRQAASAKGMQAVKQTGSGLRQSPMLPIAGLLAGSLVAARKSSKAAQRQVPQAPSDPSIGAAADDYELRELKRLTRTQLQQRAESAGVSTDAKMTKNQLIEALRNG